MVLYTPIKNIKKELSVNAKYWPQCIPIESVPDLSNSDLTKILNKTLLIIQSFIENWNLIMKFFKFFLKS